MKALRIGALLLIIGTTLLVATNLRSKSISGSMGSSKGELGPYLLEPRETTIVLREVSPPTVTISVIEAKSWEATKNITKVNPAFTVSGMRKTYAATFQQPTRGLYYIIVTTSTNQPANKTDISLEQRGIAQDLLTISLIIPTIGTIIIAIAQLKPYLKKPKGNQAIGGG